MASANNRRYSQGSDNANRKLLKGNKNAYKTIVCHLPRNVLA